MKKKPSYLYLAFASGTGITCSGLGIYWLLKKAEINSLITQMKTKHYNLIPLQVFINERGWAKVEIALVQSLKKFQVKALIKEKETKKKLQRKEYN